VWPVAAPTTFSRSPQQVDITRWADRLSPYVNGADDAKRFDAGDVLMTRA
jgi:hypothetical protein